MSIQKINIIIAFGTRPEAIKMAPLVKRLQKDDRFITKVLVTAQHREMLDQVLEIFNIKPDFDMNLMQPNQSLSSLAAKILIGFDEIVKLFHPDVILVHGDTLTANFIAQAAFLNKIKIAHIEAGLRTHNILSPWPEEANRQVISRLSNWHFSPTELNRQNLILENIPESNIFVVGNTVIDALFYISDKYATPISNLEIHNNTSKKILVTIHRRENFGTPFENICAAIKEIALNRPDIEITIPVHKNPYVQSIILETLTHIPNINLITPLDYISFINMMQESYIILTDSGGIQEEAPSLKKPVLVMRNTTERVEALEAGTVKLVGTDKENITAAVYTLLDDINEYNTMAHAKNPYGDGTTSNTIAEILARQIIKNEDI